jgi:arylsulfatase A-like enzyme
VTLTRSELLEAAGAVVVAASVDAGALAQKPDGPNVLVVVVDSLRADHVGAFGGRASTSTMDSLAREGIRFTRCHPEAMATIPARRSILTGIDMYGDPAWRGPEACTGLYERVSDYLKADRQGPVLRRMRDLYAAAITMTDRWLSVVLEALVTHGLERETIVLLVSDHGYLLGEHGWTGKVSSMLHPTLTHVPLILVDPARRGAGQTTDWFAQTHDIGPTLLQLTNVARRNPDVLDEFVERVRRQSGRPLPSCGGRRGPRGH